MKYLTLIAAMLMALSIQAQTKGDNLIIVSTEISALDAYNSVMKKLAMDGMNVEKSNNQFYTIETGWIDVGSNISTKYFMFVNEDISNVKIMVRGEYSFSNSGVSKIEKRGMNGSPMLRAWDMMVNFSKNLGFGEITYAKQQVSK